MDKRKTEHTLTPQQQALPVLDFIAKLEQAERLAARGIRCETFPHLVQATQQERHFAALAMGNPLR
ncbi:hypothetical protein [Phyllobacterium pellucidum]|uniref:hypothetical protein n=1 Tax=Phyllobacterium pellucidum TaxID=2740464 RepID=UPI001D155C00|nr:hypothetical protein [Phyllobacterium sp. T1018]UGY08641.1 hypothetical protein LLE51_011390 [Phyllobacterium sp. T1018]